MKKLLLAIVLLCSINLWSQDITGNWKGVLQVMGTELKLHFSITKDSDRYAGRLSVPQQNAKDIPLTSVLFENNQLEVLLKEAALSYTGKLNDNFEFEGTFTQRGQSFALTLVRGSAETEQPKRPQEPKAPFDYMIEEVTFENQKDKVTLSGTLTYPKNKKSFPTVILISGSGPQDRNSEIFNHKPFWVLADHLTNNGIGVLRFDDRGVGKSTGNLQEATTQDFATDVAAAVSFLKTKKQLNPKKIGLIGHSEGGMVAPMVAAKDRSIAFLVLLAAPGIPGDALLKEQTYSIGMAAGMAENELHQTVKLNEAIYTLAKSEVNAADLTSQLFTTMSEGLGTNVAFQKLSAEEKTKVVNQQIQTITTPWFRYFLRFNPRDYLEKVKCPVLALNGDKDLQVVSASNLNAIAHALKKGKNKKGSTTEYPNLNHLFQECKTGEIQEYETIPQTFSPNVMTDIKNWILLQTD